MGQIRALENQSVLIPAYLPLKLPEVWPISVVGDQHIFFGKPNLAH
jgi:hypothetical protein